MRPFAAALLLASAVVAFTAGCSGGDPGKDVASLASSGAPARTGPTSRPGEPDDFTRCLKEHGVDPIQIPGDQAGGTVTYTPPPEEEQRKRQEATEQCKKFLPQGDQQPMNPAQLEQARAIAKCMRAAGVQYPDPDPNVGGGNGAMPIPPGVDLSDPTVRAKLDECSRKAGVTSGGAGTGGSTR